MSCIAYPRTTYYNNAADQDNTPASWISGYICASVCLYCIRLLPVRSYRPLLISIPIPMIAALSSAFLVSRMIKPWHSACANTSVLAIVVAMVPGKADIDEQSSLFFCQQLIQHSFSFAMGAAWHMMLWPGPGYDVWPIGFLNDSFLVQTVLASTWSLLAVQRPFRIQERNTVVIYFVATVFSIGGAAYLVFYNVEQGTHFEWLENVPTLIMLICGLLTLIVEFQDAKRNSHSEGWWQDTHRIKGAWIQIGGCMVGMTGLAIKMILEDRCANDCPVYCPLPLNFNHNTVYHIFLGTGMYIQAHGMGILCTKGDDAGYNKDRSRDSPEKKPTSPSKVELKAESERSPLLAKAMGFYESWTKTDAKTDNAPTESVASRMKNIPPAMPMPTSMMSMVKGAGERVSHFFESIGHGMASLWHTMTASFHFSSVYHRTSQHFEKTTPPSDP